MYFTILCYTKSSSPFSIVTRDWVLAIEMAESPSLSITVTSAPFDNKYWAASLFPLRAYKTKSFYNYKYNY